MKKAAAILAWATSAAIISTISVGTAIALDPDCHAAYNKFWKKIHTPHKLDHQPSKVTLKRWKVYNEEMLRKLDFTCEVMNEDSTSSSLVRFLDWPILEPEETNALSFSHTDDRNQDYIPQQTLGLIPEKEYPVYDNPIISLESNSPPYPVGYAGGWGGWLGGGGFNPNYPQTPPSGGSPSTPIAPTPEPLPFSLVMIGAAFIVVRGRK